MTTNYRASHASVTLLTFAFVTTLLAAVFLPAPAFGQTAYFSITGGFGTAGDELDVAFNLSRSVTSGEILGFATYASSGGTNEAGDVIADGPGDSVLRLLDSSIVLVAEDDDESFLSRDSLITFADGDTPLPSPLAADNYRLNLADFNDDTDPFALDLVGPADALVPLSINRNVSDLAVLSSLTFGTIGAGSNRATFFNIRDLNIDNLFLEPGSTLTHAENDLRVDRLNLNGGELEVASGARLEFNRMLNLTTLDVDGELGFGSIAAGTSTATLAVGDGERLTVGETLGVGDTKTAILNINSGGIVTAESDAHIGGFVVNPVSSFISVNPGGRLNVDGQLRVGGTVNGPAGVGTLVASGAGAIADLDGLLTVFAGGTATSRNGGEIRANGSASVFGTLNLDGGSLAAESVVQAGGTLNLDGGTVGSEFSAMSSTINVTGGSIGTDATATSSTVNVNGGSIGNRFEANGGTVNVSAGSIGEDFEVRSGGTVNLTGGAIGNRLTLFAAGTAEVSGGTVGSLTTLANSTVTQTGGNVGQFNVRADSTVNFIGGTFQLRGNPLVEIGQTTVVTERSGDRLTGRLLDGQIFTDRLFTSSASGTQSSFASDATIRVIGAPNRDGFSTALYSPLDDVSALPSIGSDTQLNLYAGDTLPSTFSAGNFLGTTTNVELNVFGGDAAFISARTGSTVNVAGGNIATGVRVFNNATLTLTGGTHPGIIEAQAGSTVNVIGSDFEINGNPLLSVGETAVVNQPGQFLTGKLLNNATADFLLELNTTAVPGQDIINPGATVRVIGAPDPTGFSTVIYSPISNFTNQFVTSNLRIGSDTQLNLYAGDTLDPDVFSFDFEAGRPDGTSTNIEVNMYGGTVTQDTDFLAYAGSTVNISGGTVESFLTANANSTVNISGGDINFVRAESGSTVNISGGTVDASASPGGTLNLSGGTIGEGITASNDSTVNLFGTQFVLDGVDITNTLTLDVAFEITDRDVTLIGLFDDGSAFDFDLNASAPIGTDRFDPLALLTLTLSETLAGDFDFDGDVDADDIDFYSGNLGQAALGELAALDLDDDGFITLADHNQHVTQLVQTSNGEVGALIGDVNLNGQVNVLGDAFILVGNLGNSVTSWSQGDVNADQTVNVLGDAFALVGNLGSSNAGGGAVPNTTAVPEPSSISLLCLAGAAMLTRRHR